jgi:hypothetical protein
VRPAGIRGDVSADLRLLGGAGIRGEDETVLARQPSHVRSRHACLHADPPQERIEGADPRHALESKHDAAVDWNRAAGKAGAAAAGNERNLVLVTPGEHAFDLVRAAGKDDGVCSAVETAHFGLVAEVRRPPFENDALARKNRGEVALERGRSHLPQTVTASRSSTGARSLSSRTNSRIQAG